MNHDLERDTLNPKPTIVLTLDSGAPDPDVIRRAAAILRGGGLVAFPTETVYGLGVNALDPVAVASVFEAKGRPADDPLIVHVIGAEALGLLVTEVPSVAQQLAEAFWPGPLTLVLPRSAAVPDGVTAGLDTVAVREPSHPVARALIRAAGIPVAAPSANPFGRTSPTTAEHVIKDLEGRVDAVLDGGACPIGIESTVVDCTVSPPRLLRPGGVSLESLRSVVGDVDVSVAPTTGGAASAHKSPGTQKRHYAPRARLVFVVGRPADVRLAMVPAVEHLISSGRMVGLLLADEDVLGGVPEGAIVEALGSYARPEEAAITLFAALRALDDRGAEIILARDFGEVGLGRAVYDRLSRAAEGRVIRLEAVHAAEAIELIENLAGD